MHKLVKRGLIGLGAVLAVLLLIAGITIGPTIYRLTVGLKRFETTPPVLPEQLNTPAILVFSKTNAFRHQEAIEAANVALTELAARRGWSIVLTENGAVFNTEQLRRFQAVIWSNTSGDVLTAEQRTAFQNYIENGGGYVGIHAAGDNSHRAWAWYVENLIGAEFIGHPMKPQFQQATVRIEDPTHPAMRELGETWTRTDEWYSFKSSVRGSDFHVLANLDETTYRPVMTMLFRTTDLRMGDHPIIWMRCVGRGRAFYSALGHEAGAYREPQHVRMLEGAIGWAAGTAGPGCAATSDPPAG